MSCSDCCTCGVGIYCHPRGGGDPSSKFKDGFPPSWEKSHNASLIRRFNENNRKPLSGLSKKEKRFQKEYKELKKNFSYWNEVYHLKQALIETYKGVGAGSKPAQAVRNLCRGEPMCSPRPTHGSATTQMEDEANRLAIKLIQGIMRLAEEYKINTFPLVHNFLINFGLAKRGACKHWAEDILKIIEGIPRDYFVAYWAEHKPGSIAEHNVAVLAPAGATLRDGLLIDPWRTAGKPFWIRVDADHHQWKPWAFYEPK